jgi:hypothetical protein
MKKAKILQGKEDEILKMQGTKMNANSRRILEKRTLRSTEGDMDGVSKIVKGEEKPTTTRITKKNVPVKSFDLKTPAKGSSEDE